MKTSLVLTLLGLAASALATPLPGSEGLALEGKSPLPKANVARAHETDHMTPQPT